MTPAQIDARLDELDRLVRSQAAEIERLRAAIPATEPILATVATPAPAPAPTAAIRTPDAPDQDTAPSASSRRRFLRLAGTTAAGAAGITLILPSTPSSAAPASAADPYPQYVLDSGDTITGKLQIIGASSSALATEIGDGEQALSVFGNPSGVDIDSIGKQRIRMQAQTRWDSDDDGLVGSGFNIDKPAVVMRQTGEDHKGALIEFQQWLNAGPHESGVATNNPGQTFNVPKSDFYRIGWITAHYDSPNPIDTIHQHMNFETCNADLQTQITRFQISWGSDVALCSFPNSNVRVIFTGKKLSFGSGGQVAATYTDATGRLDFSGHPVSFNPGQLQVGGHPLTAPLFVRKAVDERIANLSQLQNDNDLFLELDPNATYTVSAFLNWSSDAAADLKFAWQVPSGATLVWSPDSLGITASATTGQPKKSVAGPEAVPVAGVGVGSKLAATAAGIVRTGHSGGLLRLLWSQNVAHPTTSTLYADSYLHLTRVA